jgi:hypothetical protein
MRYIYQMFVAVTIFLLGYAHVVALDEVLKGDERRAMLQKYEERVTVTWFQIIPKGEIVEHVLLPIRAAGERKFAHLTFEQFEEKGAFIIVPLEEGLKLWKESETALGFDELANEPVE